MKKNTIPKRFIRVWLGPKQIDEMFEDWWSQFKKIHPDYEFVTLTDNHGIKIPKNIKKIYDNVNSYAGRADVLRYLALDQMGGIYVDTDVMPLKSFDHLLDSDKPFIGQRSGVSFEIAVIGSPKGHKAWKDVFKVFPEYYENHIDRSASVQTGPAFLSSVWFGRKDITHLPKSTFYPYNGFMAPSRTNKLKIFRAKKSFPENMLAAHFSNSRWGGKPKDY